MLASTVQFSKYGRGPPTRHRQPPAPRAVRHQNDLSPEETVTRSLRTQQRAYHRLPRATTFHAAPKDSRTSGNTRSPAELVSVPPSSSVTNTRTHPRRGEHHGPCTALDHTHVGRGQCSLERR